MRRHLLVVSGKKIKMKNYFCPHIELSIIDGATIFFCAQPIYITNMYTIRAYYLQYCGSYAPHRRRRTMDDGRWTMDAGPSTPYYKLTGELKR